MRSPAYRVGFIGSCIDQLGVALLKVSDALFRLQHSLSQTFACHRMRSDVNSSLVQTVTLSYPLDALCIGQPKLGTLSLQLPCPIHSLLSQ